MELRAKKYVSSSHGTSQDGRATKLWGPSLSIRLNLTSVRSCHGRRKQCTPKNHPQRGQLTSCPAGRRHFSNPNWLNRKFCWSRSHVLDSEKIHENSYYCKHINILQIWGFVWKLGRPKFTEQNFLIFSTCHSPFSGTQKLRCHHHPIDGSPFRHPSPGSESRASGPCDN